MTRYEMLLEKAVAVLEDVGFPTPQLNVAWKEMVYTIAEQVAEKANHLPWEEWADDEGVVCGTADVPRYEG